MPINYGCSFKKSHLCCVEIQAVVNPTSLLVMQRFREVYCGISHLTLAFSRYTHSPKGSCVYQENASVKWDIHGNHEKVLHHYFIPYHRNTLAKFSQE